MKQRLLKVWHAITRRGPIGWFRKLFDIVRSYHPNMAIIGQHVDELKTVTTETERYVKRATKVHVDISATAKDASTVIVCGMYRGKDYVRTFPIKHGSVEELVDWLTGLSRHAQLGRLDAPPEIDATVRRELKDRGAL